MLKKYKLYVFILSAIIIPVLIFVSYFQISKIVLTSKYEKSNTSESLYNLCHYYSATSNHKKIIEFYSKLLISGLYDFSEITSIAEKERDDIHDYMIYEYMLSCKEVYSGKEFAEKFGEAFSCYNSNSENSINYTQWAVSEYYDSSSDWQTVINLYDLMFEKSDDAGTRYDIYSMKYRFIAFELGDAEKAKQEMLPELNRLYSEYEKSKSKS